MKGLAAAAATSLQLCPTLCNATDGSPPGSTAPGILQARTLEWVAISFSNAWKWKGKVKSLSRVQLLVTPWTAAHQAPLPMGFSRQEYWSGLPSPSPMKGLSALIKELSARWGYKKSATTRKILTRPYLHPHLGLPASRIVRKKFVLFTSYLVCGIFLSFYFILEHSWFTMLVSFRCTAKWFHYTYSHSFSDSFPI